MDGGFVLFDSNNSDRESFTEIPKVTGACTR